MATASVASETARDMARAADAFLATLAPQERAKATFDFDSSDRQNWHYIPRDRQGLSRGEMTAAQLKAADALIASGLSSRGYKQTRAIIDLELILREIEGRRGVIRFDRNPDLYYFRVFGSPGGAEPWGWSVEGHHVSLNFTVVNGEIISPTPSFFGANPAEVKSGPHKGLRILKDEEEFARGLLLSLEPEQRRSAVIYPTAPADLITRASRRVEIEKPAGLAAQLMSGDQRESLMSLIKVYVERKTLDVVAKALRKIEDDGVNNIHFAWAGSEFPGQGHYYRIHGPSLFVEYDKTQDNADHIHSVWRDINGDFAAGLLQEHYQSHHV